MIVGVAGLLFIALSMEKQRQALKSDEKAIGKQTERNGKAKKGVAKTLKAMTRDEIVCFVNWNPWTHDIGGERRKPRGSHTIGVAGEVVKRTQRLATIYSGYTIYVYMGYM